MTPGAHWCLPIWHQVSYVVSRQTLTYTAKSSNVPTADSVFIDVDLSINLSIDTSDPERVSGHLSGGGSATCLKLSRKHGRANGQPETTSPSSLSLDAVDRGIHSNLLPPPRPQVKKFVFTMGAERLDAYLNFQVSPPGRSPRGG